MEISQAAISWGVSDPSSRSPVPHRVSNVRNVTGSDATLTTRLKREHRTRPARPGESRFWCSCHVNREHPFYEAADLVRHVMESRALDPRHGGAQ